MPITTNDTAVFFGTQNITISGSSFYVENFSANTPTNVVDVPDEVGSPRKQVLIKGKKSGDMTIQIDSGSYIPTPGQQIQIPLWYAVSASVFNAYITSVDSPRSNTSYGTMNIGWVEKLN